MTAKKKEQESQEPKMKHLIKKNFDKIAANIRTE